MVGDVDLPRREVRQRILEAAAGLGYSPNAAARALRSRKTHIVGAAIPTLDYAIFACMMDSFQNRFSEFGYTTITLTTGFDNRTTYEKVRLLVDRGAEALLLVGGIQDMAVRDMLSSARIPAVITYSFLPEEMVSSVGFDNFAATAAVMDHLIGLGHRNFAMIAGLTEGNDRQTSRIAAYRQKLEFKGLVGQGRVLNRPFTMDAGAEAMALILERYPETTALICNTDIFAFGALDQCRISGVRVPNDISITGFNDADYASRLVPPLTTVAVPTAEMGIAAADILHGALKTGEPTRGVNFEARLIVRGSTSPPRRETAASVRRLVL